MKKLICNIFVLWGAWIAAIKYYGDNDFFLVLPEVFLLVLLISAVSGLKRKIQGIAQFFIGILLCVYFSQCIYYTQTGELITGLALDNLDQLYLIVNTKDLVGVTVLIGLLGFLLSKNKPVNCPKIVKIFIGAFLIALIAFQNNIILKHSLLRYPLRGKAPVADFTKTVIKKMMPVTKHQRQIVSYPFQKNWIYHTPLPFEEKRTCEQPNIIIIFTEGTSARLLGCYGGTRKDLTPNIDAFAKNCMQVENYYNHTAATFRGTQGQLASCYPRYGGGEKGGWVGFKSGTGVAKQLAARNYQTLPKILGKRGYSTFFLSPHAQDDPYTQLLTMLGFKNIFTRDSMPSLLDEKPVLHHVSIQDEDMYKALSHLMEKQNTDSPFLIAMYTFDTHTQVDVLPGKEKYSDGKNEVLNTLHADDAAFGKFWEYFQHSRFKDNTIVIFTADHCHYHDKSYMDLVSNQKDYTKCFHDRIPLLIYDPIHDLPSTFDANNNSSVALTPTICQLLGIQYVENSFMGTSIFEPYDDTTTILANGYLFYGVRNNKVEPIEAFDGDARNKLEKEKQKVMLFYDCEDANKVFKNSSE